MSTKFIVLLIAASWLAIAPATRAQYLCDLKASQFDDHHAERIFTAIWCTGDTCTTALDLSQWGIRNVRLLFMRSEDGGRNWITQDPRIPDRLTEYFQIRAIQQIDGANVVAVGDTGLVVRTTDGGVTWIQQHIPKAVIQLRDVSFANPLEGIIVSADPDSTIFLTTDGGATWTNAPFHGGYLWQCRAYGNGNFAIFKYASGEIYTTRDYWKTVDSTLSIFHDSVFTSTRQKVLGSCAFGAGDTLLAYGDNLIGDPPRVSPLIMRSTNRGKSWSFALDDTSLHFSGVTCMSSIDHNEIVAGCSIGYLNVLHSTNNGITWQVDTLFLPADTVTKDKFFCRGIALNSHADVIAEIGVGLTSDLVYGVRLQSQVTEPKQLHRLPAYPNPATELLHVTDNLRDVIIFDALGRSYTVPNHEGTLDVSSLPAGVYYVSDGKQRARFVKK